jgi:hypothetical protein
MPGAVGLFIFTMNSLLRVWRARTGAACAVILAFAVVPVVLVPAASARQNSTDDAAPATKPSAKSTTHHKTTRKTTSGTSSTRSSSARSSSARASSSKSGSRTHTAYAGKRSSRKKPMRARGQQKIDSERAEAIQEALIREHYLNGEPTGTWNQASEDAMRRYQSDHGWQTKEVPDSRALIKLGLGPSNARLLNPESAMTTEPDAPRAASAASLHRTKATTDATTEAAPSETPASSPEPNQAMPTSTPASSSQESRSRASSTTASPNPAPPTSTSSPAQDDPRAPQ